MDRKCTKCGTELPIIAKYCRSCGWYQYALPGWAIIMLGFICFIATLYTISAVVFLFIQTEETLKDWYIWMFCPIVAVFLWCLLTTDANRKKRCKYWHDYSKGR